jgi:hypothetical protein
MFAGEALQGGFTFQHRLYLIVRFDDSPGIWTALGTIIIAPNYVDGFGERFMVPSN